MKVKCPQCGRMSFETTEQFDSNLPPHGGMLRSLLQYHIDFLLSATTKAADLACPECLAPLVVGGALNVVMPAKIAANDLQVPIRDDTLQAHIDGDKLNIVDPRNIHLPVFICDVCGKGCKSELGLNSHKRSHKGENND